MIKTKYGKKIVLVVAKTHRDFIDRITRVPNQIPAPIYSQGVVYTREKNYRFIGSPQDMRGFRDVEVEFWPGSDEREDFNELVQLAEIARQK